MKAVVAFSVIDVLACEIDKKQVKFSNHLRIIFTDLCCQQVIIVLECFKEFIVNLKLFRVYHYLMTCRSLQQLFYSGGISAWMPIITLLSNIFFTSFFRDFFINFNFLIQCKYWNVIKTVLINVQQHAEHCPHCIFGRKSNKIFLWECLDIR